MERDGLAHYVAAIRECFEESGLLLARRHLHTDSPTHHDEWFTTVDWQKLRGELLAGNITFSQLCAAHDLELTATQLIALSHWVTPPGPLRRFDTRFFVGLAPRAQSASHDNFETTDNHWIRPAHALEKRKSGEWRLMAPTIVTLRLLDRFKTAEEVLTFAREQPTVPSYHPRRIRTLEGERTVMADHPAYAEAAKIDPEGAAPPLAEIIPGETAQLAPTVRRITAPNPGMMTGPGTNSYLIGAGNNIAVIDPGPADENHMAALIAAAGAASISDILVTHTHRDHSPGARLLQQRTGARLIGLPAPAYANQDESFQPDHIPVAGEILEVAGCRLQVIPTPGHASNHLCYLLEEEGMLFTGDHIMQGSTVVIGPPDGNMSIYMDSLHRIRDLPGANWLAPGHGFLIDQPRQAVDRLLAHRQAREAKVINALRVRGQATLSELVPLVYDDAPESRHAVASRSLLAHLEKLQNDGKASAKGEYWQFTGPT